MGTKPRILAIVGPTGTGKSDLAVELARRCDGEIISADSMQIYTGMDIGTNKIPASKRVVPHYGIDIVDPGQPYSAALFQTYARTCIEDIHSREKMPIVCGGTGFYVRAALDDFVFPKGSQEDNPVRERYQALAEEQGAEAVWNELDSLDPKSASSIHPNNTKRVIRALELFHEGESYAEQLEAFGAIGEYYPALYIGLMMPRAKLYERINLRVDMMLSEGLFDEVRNLIAKGYESALTSPQAIGYKELYAYINGERSFDEAVEAIKQATRRYAKRQLSWFGRDERIHWIDVSTVDDSGLSAALELVKCEMDRG